MLDEEKSKQELLAELTRLRQRVAELETRESEVQHRRREVEEAYRALVDYSLQGLAILGQDGIMFANPAMADILGYSVQELLDMSLEAFYETIAPAYHEFMAQRLRAWRAGKQLPSSIQIQIIRKDGTLRWIERVGVPIEYKGQRAQQIAIVDITERKEAEEALKRHTVEREMLNRAVQVFTATLDIEQVLDHVVQGLHSVLGALGSTIWLIDPQRNELVCQQASSAWQELVGGWRLKPGQGLAGLVAQSGQSLIVADVQVNEHYFGEIEQLAGLVLRSLLTVPLQAEGRVIGVIQVGDTRPNYFNDSHLRLVESLAAAASIAIQNARLYRTAQQVDQLRALNEFDQALSQAMFSLDRLAEVTLQQAAAALEAPASGLWLLAAQPEIDPDRYYTLSRGWQTDEAGCCRAWWARQGKGPMPPETCLSLLGPKDRPAARFRRADGICLPISVGDPTAVLVLGGRPADRPFTDQDHTFLQAMAGRAVQSFQSARLYQASQAHAAYLTTLHAISATVVSSLELNTVLRQVLELVCQALEATEGFILLLEQETGALFFAMTLTEKTAHLRGQRLESDRSIVASVARVGQAVRVGDVRRDARFSAYIDAVTGFETCSLICAPLTYQGQIIGVVEVVNNRPDKFSEEDLALLVAVASIAATALQNARLYTASQSRATELAILNEIGLALTSSLDYETVVRLALSLTKGLFRAERTILYQADAPLGELRLVAMQPVVAGGATGESASLVMAERAAEWVMAHRLPALGTDLAQNQQPIGLASGLPLRQLPTLMAVPLLVTGRAVGVLTVSRHHEEAAYTLDDLRTLQSVSSILVMALHNARLYAEQVRLLREQERTQQQLVHTEKMVALGRLVAAIMHEINNPLQAIQSFLGLAQEEVQGEQRQAELRRYLGITVSEVNRISNIIRRLRDFYSPATEGLKVIDINGILDGVLDLTGKQLERERIVVERLCDPALPPLEANADQLRQVFLNLVLNAIDAMPGGGILRVVTSPEPPAEAPAGPSLQAPCVRIEFSDTGKGMPPEIQGRLFEPFFTTKTFGSGLGLSISYSIIRAHRGQLSFVSHPGLGTTFKILLPIQQLEGDEIR